MLPLSQIAARIFPKKIKAWTPVSAFIGHMVIEAFHKYLEKFYNRTTFSLSKRKEISAGIRKTY